LAEQLRKNGKKALDAISMDERQRQIFAVAARTEKNFLMNF